jgi:hypothetical protein
MTELMFNKFKYLSDWAFKRRTSRTDPSVMMVDATFEERFQFLDNSLLRVQKQQLYMYPLKYYVKQANAVGFTLVKVIDLLPVGHDHSYIYVFQLSSSSPMS